MVNALAYGTEQPRCGRCGKLNPPSRRRRNVNVPQLTTEKESVLRKRSIPLGSSGGSSRKSRRPFCEMLSKMCLICSKNHSNTFLSLLSIETSCGWMFACMIHRKLFLPETIKMHPIFKIHAEF